jgi:hypothetical protein
MNGRFKVVWPLDENWRLSFDGRWPKLASQNRESAPCSFAAIQRYEAKIPALDRKLIQGISQKAHDGHKFGLVMPILCLSYRSLKQFCVCSCPHEYHTLIRATAVQLIDQ